mmetsp:Transcript_124142/g.356590  ORF Transcript_124142/g.356590 Transcript_124142/m.356590 type:complete len:204 (-) Transcript_124142:696-1307(-)
MASVVHGGLQRLFFLRHDVPHGTERRLLHPHRHLVDGLGAALLGDLRESRAQADPGRQRHVRLVAAAAGLPNDDRPIFGAHPSRNDLRLHRAHDGAGRGLSCEVLGNDLHMCGAVPDGASPVVHAHVAVLEPRGLHLGQCRALGSAFGRTRHPQGALVGHIVDRQLGLDVAGALRLFRVRRNFHHGDLVHPGRAAWARTHHGP